ncbi:MAG: tyrosine-type recombinase/integrase [Actinomycetia bacterium]|nr:tyrosine-type recombinase/integrase [Actinomycetes bacterium]
MAPSLFARLDLRDFVAWMAAEHHQTVTVPASFEWAVAPRPGTTDLAPSRAPRRIAAVRGFASYLKAVDAAHEVPPAGAFGFHTGRITPHIWTASETDALLAASRQLRRPGRHITYPVLFGLLATTGMRVGEALHLTRRDVDLDNQILTVTWGKSRNPRLVPIHPTTTATLHEYDTHRPSQATASEAMFFTRHDGGPLPYYNALYAFRQACQTAGLAPAPRIHKPAWTSTRSCRPCRLTWATSTRRTPTGT